MTIQEYEEKLLKLIDDGIDTATDDELFAGGYLRGHISLAAADCELSGANDIEMMKVKIITDIYKSKNELSPQDFKLVITLINDLIRYS